MESTMTERLPVSIRPYRDDADRAALLPIFQQAFNAPEERLAQYFEIAPTDAWRLADVGERTVGGMLRVPMGQYFGGVPVPMLGVATVAVDPTMRGRGCATGMMQQVVREMHDERCPISTLFASTQHLYRKAGFEQAGSTFTARIATKQIRVGKPTLQLRKMTDADLPMAEALYRKKASRFDGHLDRGPHIWRFARQPRSGVTWRYVVERDGSPEGYVVYGQERIDGRSDFHVTDLVALTPEAGQSILAFFAGHGTLGRNVSWRSAPNDPLLLLLGENGVELALTDLWMLRITHAPAALTQRGYPAGVRGELHLEVRDDVIPSHNGRCVLHVEDGQGHVEPGGEGRMQIDIRGLASLYTGFRTPRQLSMCGQATGDDASLATAAAMFASNGPWMVDMF
jgi:predicted acetyltransferase